MSTVILHLAQTIDGYISRKDGSVDYLGEFGKDMIDSFTHFVSTIDVVIMGRKTFDEYNKYGWDMYKSQTIYVWTTTPRENYDNIIFFTGTLDEFLETNKNKTIWCFGGTKVVQEFLSANAVDIFEIATVPYLLGDGKKLFEPGNYELQLEQVGSKVVDDIVMTTYKKVS